MSRLRSKPEVIQLERHVRSTLKSRQRQAAPACPLLPTRPIQRV